MIFIFISIGIVIGVLIGLSFNQPIIIELQRRIDYYENLVKEVESMIKKDDDKRIFFDLDS